MKAPTSLNRPLLSFILRFIRPYRGPIVIAMCALLFTASITLTIGQGVRLLIDQGFATRSPEMLRYYVLVFFALVVALAVGTFTRFYWVTWLGERVVADIRRAVFSHLIALHPSFFEANRSLEIQSRLTADTAILQSVIGSSVSVALRNLVMLIGGVIWLFITNAKLTLIVLISVPVVVAPILIYGRRVRHLSRKSQDSIAVVGAYVGEMLKEIKTVQAYNHQSYDIEQFNSNVEQSFTVAKQRIAQRALLITVVIVLVLGAVGLMLWVGGMDVMSGAISGGELAAFIFYSVLVGSAVGSISEVVGELQRAAGATERLVELMETRNTITAPEHDRQSLASPIRGAIRIENAVFCYPQRPERRAIDDICLSVEPGESLALVGPSGAGKSTLFDLMLRFYDVNQGRILVDEVDITSLDPPELRACFALVSQNPAIFHGSVASNIRFGKPQASESALINAAKAANAHEFISQLPEGYNTLLGESGVGLSGGQRQRLAIARALLKDAPILLLDEATSALDAENEQLVQEALDRLMQQRTSIIIAHRLATVKNADRIALIHQGKIQAVGTHAELYLNNAIYQRLARLQFDLHPKE